MGPLPSNQGYSYLLTMINCTPCWPEVALLTSISAESCVWAFLSTWVSRFDVPAILTCDRGAQFTSSVCSRVCLSLGILASTTYYNLLSFSKQWDDRAVPPFPQICSSFTSIWFRLFSSSSVMFYWVWGRFPVMILASLSPRPFMDLLSLFLESSSGVLSCLCRWTSAKIEQAVAGFAIPAPHHVPQSLPCQLPAALLSAKYVLVREDAYIPSLAPLYRGLYLVLEQRDKFFRLQIGSRTDVVSVDRLKPVFSDKPVLPALPPACGCSALRAPGAIICPPVVLVPLSAALPVHPARRVCFQLPPSVPDQGNPCRAVRDRRCFAINCDQA